MIAVAEQLTQAMRMLKGIRNLFFYLISHLISLYFSVTLWPLCCVCGRCVCGEMCGVGGRGRGRGVCLVCGVCGVRCVWCESLKRPPCVPAKRLRVYLQHVHKFYTCGRGASTNADVLNVHTEAFWMDMVF